jgi:hypothetical protein
LAFIRHKKVHGHKYYQAVRNYRDKNGKHRQEVLCHLGVHSSLDAAIDSERKRVKIDQELALSHRTRAKHLRGTILERHGSELPNGEIPNVAETTRQLTAWNEHSEAWYEQLWKPWNEQEEGFFDPDDGRTLYHSGTEYLLDIEESIDIQIVKYESCMGYHVILNDARVAEFRAGIHQTKLDKLLRVQQKYFLDSSSANNPGAEALPQ